MGSSRHEGAVWAVRQDVVSAVRLAAGWVGAPPSYLCLPGPRQPHCLACCLTAALVAAVGASALRKPVLQHTHVLTEPAFAFLTLLHAQVGPVADGMVKRGVALTTVRKFAQGLAFVVPAACMLACGVLTPTAGAPAANVPLLVGLLSVGFAFGAWSRAGLYCNHQVRGAAAVGPPADKPYYFIQTSLEVTLQAAAMYAGSVLRRSFFCSWHERRTVCTHSRCLVPGQARGACCTPAQQHMHSSRMALSNLSASLMMAVRRVRLQASACMFCNAA